MAPEARKPTRTAITWGGVAVVVAVGVLTALSAAPWAAYMSMGAVAAGIGVWRAVQLLGTIVDHLHWRDVEVPAEADEGLS